MPDNMPYIPATVIAFGVIAVILFTCQSAPAAGKFSAYVPAEVSMSGMGAIGESVGDYLGIGKGLIFDAVALRTAVDGSEQVVCGSVHLDGMPGSTPFIGVGRGLINGSRDQPAFGVLEVGVSRDSRQEVEVMCLSAGFVQGIPA